MNKKNILYALFVIALLNNACKKDAKMVDLGEGFYPNNIGHFCIYQVDSTVWDDFLGKIIHYQYQIKEVIESDITDTSNRRVQQTERYYRAKEADAWQIRDIWTVFKSPVRVEKYEENMHFVKLIFPVKENKTWNGNALNTIGEWNYEYANVNDEYEINGFSFDSTLTVIQRADSSLIEKQDYQEVYAKNVGLIYKRFVDVKDKSSKINFSLSLMERVDAGFDYSYKLLSYGN